MNRDKPWLKARLIIEILGAPEMHVNETLALVGDKFGADVPEIKVKDIKVREAQKVKVGKSDNFYSGFVEIDADFAELSTLIGVIFDWMPSSIEVYEPSQVSDDLVGLNGVINDLIARLHQYDKLVKNLKAQNILLERELKKLKPAGKKSSQA